MRRDNFHCYKDIIAFDAGFGFKNGTGVALFDYETYRLKACGLIRLFAPGMEDHQATIEMADKSKLFWEEHVGFSYDPEILCIEYPQHCFIRNGYAVRHKTIIMLGILCARIEAKFSSRILLRPSPQNWKGSKSKEQTQLMVLERLCAWSKKTLARDLAAIPLHLHHNVYDAIALGLWAIGNQQNGFVSKPDGAPLKTKKIEQ
jgi:hypothetical protein